MKARVGDKIVIKGHRVDEPDRDAVVLEVRGPDGEPPYQVRWGDDGHEGLFFPGSDATVVHYEHGQPPATSARPEAPRAPRVRDVMTTDLVTIGPESPFAEIVDRLLAHDISSVPVIDGAGRLLGVVSEADLVSREAYGPERRRPLGLVLDYLRGRDPAWVRKSSGATASELMTRVVTTVGPDDSLPTAARAVLEGGHTCLPVVSEGRVVGVVARRDLLAHVYAS